MKRKILVVVIGLIALIGAYSLGATQEKTVVKTEVIKEKIEVVPEGYINTTSEEFINNYIDMRTVVDFKSNDGLQIYCVDGSGYYWER